MWMYIEIYIFFEDFHLYMIDFFPMIYLLFRDFWDYLYFN